MGLFTAKRFDTLEELFVAQLQDLYDAEYRLITALPKMAEAAHAPDLKHVFHHHLHETQGQLLRLEQVFAMLSQEAKRETCDAMKGLISEGDEMIQATGDPDVIDAALIAAAQRVEHYEISGYGTARSLAQQLGHGQAAQLLQASLDEEAAADEILTQVAESLANVRSARP